MSGLYIRPFEPDALSDDDDREARLAHVISELERAHRSAIEGLREEAKHWRIRFQRYETFCGDLLEQEHPMARFNSLGELQGNVEKFDGIVMKINVLEDSLAEIRKILYPGESRVVRSAGKTNKSTTGKRTKKPAGRNPK